MASYLENLNPSVNATAAKVALFDFDGTLSLLRAGWAGVMTPMMGEELAQLKTGETEAQLEHTVREFVDRLTGKQTIYQMIELARQVELRGGRAAGQSVYKPVHLQRFRGAPTHR